MSNNADRKPCCAGCARLWRCGSNFYRVCLVHSSLARRTRHCARGSSSSTCSDPSWLTLNRSPDVAHSVLLVLATAIPKESISYVLASSSAFAEQMASSLAAGNTPAWYQALPADVKTLLPAVYPAAASATPTPTPSSSSSLVITSSSVSARPTAVNSTVISTVQSPTLHASSSVARTSAPPVATGAAAYPSAALGAGVGAALGFLGMLAL